MFGVQHHFLIQNYYRVYTILMLCTETHFESPQNDDCGTVQKVQTQNGLKAYNYSESPFSMFFLFMAS